MLLETAIGAGPEGVSQCMDTQDFQGMARARACPAEDPSWTVPPTLKTGRGGKPPFSPVHIVPEYIVWSGLGGQSATCTTSGRHRAVAMPPWQRSSQGQRLYRGMSKFCRDSRLLVMRHPMAASQQSSTGQRAGCGLRSAGQNEGMYCTRTCQWASHGSQRQFLGTYEKRAPPRLNRAG